MAELSKKQSSKNYFIAVTLFTLVFVAVGLIFWFKYLRPVDKGTEGTAFPLINLEDQTILNDITKPDVGLFESCLNSSNIDDYESRKANDIIGSAERITTPEYINFPVEFYSVPVKTAFGVETNDTVLYFNESYCELTEANWQTLATPLKSTSVIDYMILRNVSLSSSSHDKKIVSIINAKDYDEYKKAYKEAKNEDSVIPDENKLTTFEEKNDRFIISWVYYYPEELEILNKEIVILKNGLVL